MPGSDRNLDGLDERVASAIDRLDQLILRLDGYKPLLEHNFNSAGLNLRASFLSIAQALEERQMSLMDELQRQYEEKRKMIEIQKETIDALRRNILEMDLSSPISRQTAHSELGLYLSQAELAARTSNATPFLSFRGEIGFAQQFLSNYGRIISRYCGHFVDPSQPSSCLPRAVEEEEEENYDASSGAVFGRISTQCNCIQPKLRPWISALEHKCTSPMSSAFPTAGKYDYRLKEEVKSPSHVPPAEESIRCRSANSDEADSQSFDILTNSSGRSLTVMDWLFCDPLEVTKMPGLSTRFPPSTPSAPTLSRTSPVVETSSEKRLNEVNSSSWLSSTETLQAASKKINKVDPIIRRMDQIAATDWKLWLSPDRIEKKPVDPAKNEGKACGGDGEDEFEELTEPEKAY